jgi:hypothetical protein
VVRRRVWARRWTATERRDCAAGFGGLRRSVGNAILGIVIKCQHCGYDLDVPPHPHDLRPMPVLQDESSAVPMAVVCPECDKVVRVTYPTKRSGPVFCQDGFTADEESFSDRIKRYRKALDNGDLGEIARPVGELRDREEQGRIWASERRVLFKAENRLAPGD